jgi:hypothetical protein
LNIISTTNWQLEFQIVHLLEALLVSKLTTTSVFSFTFHFGGFDQPLLTMQMLRKETNKTQQSAYTVRDRLKSKNLVHDE